MASQETGKIYALDLDREEWVERLAGIGQPKFRADQLVQWLWQKRVYDVNEMTNLSKSMRDEMKQIIDFQLPDMIKEQRSKDGTRKFLWRFRDGQTVESVLMQYNDRLTACLSTQVGCPLQCLFCATGLSGFSRNLSPGEIAAQFLAMEKIIGHDISNVVYMGMGEPFLNTDNVLKSIHMLNDDKMRNLGIRHFTVSTSGVLPGIIALANSGLRVRLAISLHAVDDELRGQLMPINQRYPLAELRETMEEYQKITGDRITIEYALFGGVNDSVEHARELVRYLKGIHVFINLIPFNAVDGRFEKPSAEAVLKFRKVLDTAGFEAEIRQERGADIDAACGQLRRKASSGEACRLDDKPGFRPSADDKPRKTGGERRAGKPAGERTRAKTTRTYKRTDSEPGSGSYGTERKKTGSGFAGKRADDKPRKTYGERGGEKSATKENFGESSRKQREKTPGKKPFEKQGDISKRRKTSEPDKEHYRSGKKKEERPSFKGQREGSSPVEREGKWYEGASKQRAAKPLKASAKRAVKTPADGAKRKPKAAPKQRAKKK